MKILIKDISSLVTVAGNNEAPRKGESLKDIGEIKNGAVFFDDKIIWVGTTLEAETKLENQELIPDEVISLKGKTVFPGFIDSHTHLVFAGDRSAEFARRLAGATYQEIAREGGGILATVNAVRKASEDELFENASKYLKNAMRYGTIAIEIKSGYGLDVESELKMLRVIEKLGKEFPIDVVPTFLGAHDFPPEYKSRPDDYVAVVCNEMIPQVAELGLAKYCDCFVDKGYYTIEQAAKIFETAQQYGMKVRVHADELADVGAAKFAASIGAISADHLLFVSDEGIEYMSKFGTIATLLPGTSYFLKMPYAPARKLIEQNVPIALATDFNPGSCFTENMQMILSLAVINLGLNCEEAIVASTINAAHSLELNPRLGSLEPGKDSTFAVLDAKSYIDIFYHFGVNHIESVWVKGKKIF